MDSSISAFNQRVKTYAANNPKKKATGPAPDRTNIKTGFGLRFVFFPIMLVLALVFGTKAMILLDVGEYEYNKQLSLYRDPNVGEQIGLFVMRADPVTLKLRDFAKVVLAR